MEKKWQEREMIGQILAQTVDKYCHQLQKI
jgi:hypothetical protein